MSPFERGFIKGCGQAGVVATDRRRLSPLPHSRNNHVVYVLPEAA